MCLCLCKFLWPLCVCTTLCSDINAMIVIIVVDLIVRVCVLECVYVCVRENSINTKHNLISRDHFMQSL